MSEQLRPYLLEVVGRHLPSADADATADALLNYDPDNPEHVAIVNQLDEAIPAAAANHAPGISPSERAALEDETGSSLYALGPGDRQVYAALRDSNLLNAVVGRKPADPTLFRNGLNYAVDGEYNPVSESYAEGPNQGVMHRFAPGSPQAKQAREHNRRWLLDNAVKYYERGGEDPTAHSSISGAHYPQHALHVENASRLGDTALGSAFSYFGTLWGDASRRAQRTDEPDLLADNQHSDAGEFSMIPGAASVANAIYKGGKNLLSSLSDSSEHEWAKLDHNRASPPVPDGMTAEQRQAFIQQRADAIDKSKPPTIQQYGASKGIAYSPAGAWMQDITHDFLDPFTMLSGTAIVKGSGGVLKNLGSAAVKEAGDELSSPMNYAAALTAPFNEGAAAFAVPEKGTIPATAKEDYSRQQREIADNIKSLRSMREQSSR
jgi:hypothetical protein